MDPATMTAVATTLKAAVAPVGRGRRPQPLSHLHGSKLPQMELHGNSRPMGRLTGNIAQKGPQL